MMLNACAEAQVHATRDRSPVSHETREDILNTAMRGLKVYRSLMHICDDIVVHNAALKVCLALRSAEIAEDIFQNVNHLDIPKNVNFYRALLAVYGETGDVDKTLFAFNCLQLDGFAADGSCYQYAMGACQESSDWEVAVELFKKMVKDGIPINSITFNTVINTCMVAGKWDLGLHFFELMEDMQVPKLESTFNILIDGADISKKPDDALAFFTQAKTAGVSPTIMTFNVLLSALRHKSDEALLVRVLQEAFEMGIYGPVKAQLEASPALHKLDVHTMSLGASHAAVLLWLENHGHNAAVAPQPTGTAPAVGTSDPVRLEIVTGWGKSKAAGKGLSQQPRYLEELVQRKGFQLSESKNPGRIAIDFLAAN